MFEFLLLESLKILISVWSWSRQPLLQKKVTTWEKWQHIRKVTTWEKVTRPEKATKWEKWQGEKKWQAWKSDNKRKGYNVRKIDKTWEKGDNMIKSENMRKSAKKRKKWQHEKLNLMRIKTCKSLCLGVGEGELEAQRLSSSSDESKELLLPPTLIRIDTWLIFIGIHDNHNDNHTLMQW